MSYVMAVRRSDTFTMPGGERRADDLIAAAPPRSWQRISAGAGAHGPREYHWTRVPVRPGWEFGRGRWLLARRSLTSPEEISYYACYGSRRSSTADLAWAAGSRWHTRPGGKSGIGTSDPGMIGYTLAEIRRLLAKIAQQQPPGPEHAWS